MAIEPERLRQAREAYEGSDKPVTQIASEFGIAEWALRREAVLGAWSRVHRPRRRSAKPPPIRMVERLYQAVERQLDEIEARMKKSNASLAEKDARTLGSLAHTLEKLIRLKATTSDPAEAAEPVDLDQLYQELSRRLHRLSEGGG